MLISYRTPLKRYVILHPLMQYFIYNKYVRKENKTKNLHQKRKEKKKEITGRKT